MLPEALTRIEAGERGAEQSPEGESYAGFFEPEFAELDSTRPAEEVHRQVRAWWLAAARDGVHGPLTDLARRPRPRPTAAASTTAKAARQSRAANYRMTTLLKVARLDLAPKSVVGC